MVLGKVLLLKALLGFYPPAEGDINFFAKNAKTHTLTQVRELIAYVPQDPHLFEGTIEEILDLGGLMQRGRNLLKQPKLRMLTNLFWGCLMDTKPSLERIRYVYQEDNGKE
ncbi:ATP-binding cassette domain-containing protein [Brevibacillus laterosporus]|uniref:ATP-binding cassette domain-containing protein n=1 Tax=Brevibacillus laterosporus TaxID=1465 RepID=UPI0003B184F4|nr:ATP-binding cassette domain-containing protein [Brevibacillus laterosporus]ERM16083.1 hypothetical protein P615_05210 [Brevibacillus laterosporus PE36]